MCNGLFGGRLTGSFLSVGKPAQRAGERHLTPMSYAQTLAGPAIQAGSKLLRGETIRSMARPVGVVLSAGALAAVYQVAHDEVRASLGSWRQRSQYRSQRHEVVLITVLGGQAGQPSPIIQQRYLHARDAFKESLAILTDATVTTEDRKIIQDVLNSLRPRVIEA
jgi:hypothetical protein